MVTMTLSFKTWCLRYHREIYSLLMFGHVELLTDDMKKEYLEFLVTMTGKPLLYVPGNHDKNYETDPPGGCECLDGRVMTCKGLRIAGLGGSARYNPGPCQYTEKEMRKRTFKLERKIRKKQES